MQHKQMLTRLSSHFLKNTSENQKQFNLFRHFSLVSLSGFVIAAGALSVAYRHQSVRNLVSITEKNNVALAQVLSNSISDRYGTFLFSEKPYSPQELTSSSVIKALTAEAIAELEGSAVAKIKIYDLNGLTVFSTERSQIGNDKSQSKGYIKAKSGEVVSQLGHRDTFQALNSTLEKRDFLSSYIPIYSKGNRKQIVGVFEVYTDVTPLVRQIRVSQRNIYLGSFLILIVLYLSLVAIVLRADKLLTSQYQQVQNSKDNYYQQSQELETALSRLKKTQAQMLQSEKMSALGQMVAGVAHEINNPVNFIHGNIDYVQTHVSDILRYAALYDEYHPEKSTELESELEDIDIDFVKEDLEKTLSSIKTGTSRIRNIVLSLRNFSRMDEAALKTANIHEGIESTLMLLGHRLEANAKRPQIQVSRDFDRLPLVNCYAGQLNQVFMNILTNAIDAIEESYQKNVTKNSKRHAAPNITIRTEIKGNSVVIGIADNGPGIPESLLSRIFDPFFTTKEVGKGTGMGMAIAHQIITERHQGKIQCFSDSDIGTEFIIELPCNLEA